MPSAQSNVVHLNQRLTGVDPALPAGRPIFIPVDELLTPAFLARHTPFADFRSLLLASGFRPQHVSGLEDTANDDWEKFIRRVSHFSTWSAMLKAARGEWIMHRMGIRTDACPEGHIDRTEL